MSSTSITSHPITVRGISPRAVAPRQPASPAQLTRRGRMLLVALLLVCACVALSLGRASVATTTPPPAEHYNTVTVQQGQTLWEIARMVAPQADPRATISRIVDLNALPSADDIRPGLRLAIPSF